MRKYKKVFVTVGTTRFDLLCGTIMTEAVLEALKKIGCKEITFQVGNSVFETGNYEENGVKVKAYRFKDSIQDDILEADLVISHAGAGSCLEALEAKKPLLVVVNEDLMDNHQIELAEQLQIDGHLYYCTCDTLEGTLNEVDFECLLPLPKAQPFLFVNFLESHFSVQS